MITFYEIEVAIRWMGYKLARRVREGDRILFEFHSKLWYLENPREYAISVFMVLRAKGHVSVGTIGNFFSTCPLFGGTIRISICILDFTKGNGYSPKNASRNTDQTFWTKFCRKTPSIVKVLKNQRREVHEVLVCIVDP